MILTLKKIGGSKGIIIPKNILDRLHISKEIDLHVEDDKIIIENIHKAREGWEYSFKEMSKNNDDELIANDILDDIEGLEW